MSDDWHKDTPEPRHWLFYVLVKVGVALFAFKMRLVRIAAVDVSPGAHMRGEVLLETSSADIDNMEALAVHTLPDGSTRITIVSDSDHFLFKPNSIYVPFGLDPAKLRVPLAPAVAKRDIELIRASAVEIDPDSRAVALDDGRSLPYDRLVVATGSGMRATEIPGLAEHAIPTWTPEDMVRLGGAFRSLAAAPNGTGAAAARRRILFLVPPNNKCAGPLYEIVLMLETWLRRQGARERVEINWATSERTYIQAFGPRLHEVVTEEFERRGITGMAGHVVERIEPGRVEFAGGPSVAYDTLVAFPPYVAAQAFPGLPTDDRGFIATESRSRRVASHPEIFAVGDAGDFPVKQAFLAFLQADAAAAHLGTGSGPEPTRRT